MSNVQALVKEWRYLLEEKRNEPFTSFELTDVNERIAEELRETLKEVEADRD